MKYDRVALVALCKSDNLDSAFAPPETELQLLKAIHDSLEVLQPPLGQTQWGMVRKLAMEQCAQRWEEVDICSIYNFSKAVGATHIEFLTEVVPAHVDWGVLAVRPGYFHTAGRLSAKLPWLKVALITAQYLPPDDKKEKGPYGKHFGTVVPRSSGRGSRKQPIIPIAHWCRSKVSCPIWQACI